LYTHLSSTPPGVSLYFRYLDGSPDPKPTGGIEDIPDRDYEAQSIQDDLEFAGWFFQMVNDDLSEDGDSKSSGLLVDQLGGNRLGLMHCLSHYLPLISRLQRDPKA